MKPQLASDYDPKHLILPVVVQPKIDGVRGMNLDGRLTGRSLKLFKNKALTAKFSGVKFLGLDGELAAGPETSPTLCSDTTSAVNTVERHADDIVWHVFDFVTEDTVHLPYVERYTLLQERVRDFGHPNILIVCNAWVTDAAEVDAWDSHFLNQGYEGTILRNPNAAYKEGRPSKKLQQYIRIKRFVDAEAVVLAVVEGRQNLNEAVTNELGRTERSTHAENMVPNGKVGSLTCRDVTTGQEITVSAGAMTEEERLYYFQWPQQIVGKTITYKTFPKGVKDKPRFPTFKHIRSEEDIDETSNTVQKGFSK